ncbi:ankyrin repeat domain-containing protein [Wolbachia endosymbiont (group A) of Bombylius major]|uniref:ankyrin repeat domain-containing protein n=1 Tax=Wolbachia endosymbiont (group A) of Bombylius major TaxID=2953988 RepID=UPI0022301EB5|nr:ankyrin repeat domain-containing protein [Wolbachia endosymbiont (group A) of Bombylius major]
MTMNYKQWKEILGAVNKETDLSKDNVIDKIKEELKKYPEEYKKWEEAGFGVNHLFEDDQLTLLHLAASCGYAKIVNLLIENDASVDVEYKGVTPLHRAVGGGHTDIVEILVKNGAKVDAKTNVEEFKGYTPLHCAGEGGHTKIAKFLIANGADPL